MGAFSPQDFGNVLLTVLIIFVFNNKWLYQNDLKNIQHIKILTLLAVLFFNQQFVNPRATNFKFCPLEIFPPLKTFLRAPMDISYKSSHNERFQVAIVSHNF